MPSRYKTHLKCVTAMLLKVYNKVANTVWGIKLLS